MEKQLTAVNLKNTLWDTLLKVKSKEMPYADADAVASQAREIIRTTKVQLQIAAATNRAVPQDVISFSETPATTTTNKKR